MPSVQQLLSDIRIKTPSSTATFTDGVVIGYMNDAQNEIWRYMASTEIYEFTTIAGQALYSMSSDMAIDMIKSLKISNSTVIDGTETYVDYEYAGPDDVLSGNKFYDALGLIGIYPVPSSDTGSGYSAKITYEAKPVQLSTNTLTTVPSINDEYHDILKWRACRDIVGSGNNPDTMLASYYQGLYDKLFRLIKMDYNKRKAANPKTSYPRSEGWYNG